MDKKIKYFILWAFLSGIIILIFGIPTALIPNDFFAFTRMFSPTIIDYFFLFTTSLLFAAVISLYFYRKSLNPNQTYSAFGGTLGGILSFACPACNVLLVGLLGTTAILTFIEPYRPLFGVVSIVLLSYAVYSISTNKSCKVAETQESKA